MTITRRPASCSTITATDCGKGSDIFIDGVGSKGNLTSGYGDIKITANDMLMLLGYLDSDKHPTLTVS